MSDILFKGEVRHRKQEDMHNAEKKPRGRLID